MKINFITLNQNSKYKLNNNTNNASSASPKNQFFSYQKILFPEDEVSFSKKHTKFKKETVKFSTKPEFEFCDFMKQLEGKFENGENDECAEDLRNFYIKNQKAKNKTISTDNGTIKIFKDRKIGAYFKRDDSTKSSIIVELNRRNKIVAYTTNNSKPNGFNCIKTFSYNYPYSLD